MLENALRSDPESSMRNGDVPLNEAELLDGVIRVWQDLLGVTVGADTDFFAAGGRSLFALQMLAEVRTRYGLQIPLEVFLSSPTPRIFTAHLAALRADHLRQRNGQSSIDAIANAIDQAVGNARHLGIQLYVSVAGQVVCDVAVGQRDTGDEIAADDLLPWYSGGKPMLAAAVLKLRMAGRLDLDAPLSNYLPEFAAGREFSCRHLLTHTTGRLIVDGHSPLDPTLVGYEQAIDLALTARLSNNDRPGMQPSYSVSGLAWLLLAEVVRRIDGRRFDHYVSSTVFEPLGIEAYYGFSDEQLDRLGPRVTTYHHQPRVAQYQDTSHSHSVPVDRTRYTRASFHRGLDPSQGLWMSARGMARFYEHACARSTDANWFGPSGPLDGPAAQEMTRPQRPSYFQEAPLVDFGLGVTLESRRHGPNFAYFGSYTGNRSFGHQGHGSSPMAFVDPDHELVVSFNGNGLPGRVVGKLIWHRISDAVYTDLGFAT
ncbi:serine hydrolase [Nocardia sp. NPDC058114]|uniref:serine hydrolase n=1 Tax=Nocardia sp. NPDC058114 TaxID=3346346 RepID=UPI0036DEF0F8